MMGPLDPLAFSYSRSVAPMMWVFAGIMAAELAVTHLLVSALWNGTAAGIFSGLTLIALIWTVMLIRSFKRLPVIVGPDEIVMRLGLLKPVRVPAGQIAGVRTSWPSGAEKKRGVFNMALISYPNVMLDLDPNFPGTRKRPLSAVAHRLDDPAGFAAAVRRLLGTG